MYFILMNTLNIPKVFSLETFAQVYTSHAFEAASKGVSLTNFDDEIRKKTSSDLNLPIDFIIQIHHPFHWIFFRDEGHPFDLVNPANCHEVLRVQSKKQYIPKEIEDYTKRILIDYGLYLNSKIERIIT
jgi:hypothetical protein